MIQKIGNKFLLVSAAAQRAKAISEGALPLIDMFSKGNPLDVALKEVAFDKVKFHFLKETEQPGRAVRKWEGPAKEAKDLPFGGLTLSKVEKKKYKRKKK